MPSMFEATNQSAVVLRPFTVPETFRAWAHWCAKCGGGGVQVAQVKALLAAMGEERADQQLCEVLARANMELAIALQFDEVDTHVDEVVCAQISELFGPSRLDTVRRMVSEAGPVFERRKPLPDHVLEYAVAGPDSFGGSDF